MTDKEMVIALGNYIIGLQRDISALRGAFLEYRLETPEGRREIPFLEVARRVAEEESFQRVAIEQRRELLQALSDETQDSALIRGLYRRFLEE